MHLKLDCQLMTPPPLPSVSISHLILALSLSPYLPPPSLSFPLPPSFAVFFSVSLCLVHSALVSDDVISFVADRDLADFPFPCWKCHGKDRRALTPSAPPRRPRPYFHCLRVDVMIDQETFKFLKGWQMVVASAFHSFSDSVSVVAGELHLILKLCIYIHASAFKVLQLLHKQYSWLRMRQRQFNNFLPFKKKNIWCALLKLNAGENDEGKG